MTCQILRDWCEQIDESDTRIVALTPHEPICDRGTIVAAITAIAAKLPGTLAQQGDDLPNSARKIRPHAFAQLDNPPLYPYNVTRFVTSQN